MRSGRIIAELISAVASSSIAAMVRLICIPVTKLAAPARMAPKTAMATAPPTWRNVLNTALAVPACSAGTLSRTTLVMAGIAIDPPGPMSTSTKAVSSGDPSGAVMTSRVSPTTISSQPGHDGHPRAPAVGDGAAGQVAGHGRGRRRQEDQPGEQG